MSGFDILHYSTIQSKSTSLTTSPDVTVCLEDKQPHRSREEGGEGRSSATRGARKLGDGLGARGPESMEEGAFDRPTHLEDGGAYLPDKPRGAGQIGKSIKDQRRSRALESTSLPPGLLPEKESPTSPRWKLKKELQPVPGREKPVPQMARTYNQLKVNMGALRQIASKKMRRW